MNEKKRNVCVEEEEEEGKKDDERRGETIRTKYRRGSRNGFVAVVRWTSSFPSTDTKCNDKGKKNDTKSNEEDDNPDRDIGGVFDVETTRPKDLCTILWIWKEDTDRILMICVEVHSRFVHAFDECDVDLLASDGQMDTVGIGFSVVRTDLTCAFVQTEERCWRKDQTCFSLVRLECLFGNVQRVVEA